MIHNKLSREVVFEILKDGLFHFDREFLNAGLCEYRQPIDQLRKRGFLIQASDRDDRPGFTLLNPYHVPDMPVGRIRRVKRFVQDLFAA